MAPAVTPGIKPYPASLTPFAQKLPPSGGGPWMHGASCARRSQWACAAARGSPLLDRNAPSSPPIRSTAVRKKLSVCHRITNGCLRELAAASTLLVFDKSYPECAVDDATAERRRSAAAAPFDAEAHPGAADAHVDTVASMLRAVRVQHAALRVAGTAIDLHDLALVDTVVQIEDAAFQLGAADAERGRIASGVVSLTSSAAERPHPPHHQRAQRGPRTPPQCGHGNANSSLARNSSAGGGCGNSTAGGGLGHIQWLHGMLYAYWATVVEVVRMKEFECTLPPKWTPNSIRAGVIARECGMTSLWTDQSARIPVTVRMRKIWAMIGLHFIVVNLPAVGVLCSPPVPAFVSFVRMSTGVGRRREQRQIDPRQQKKNTNFDATTVSGRLGIHRVT
ncbi:hypothetical protein B0H17DRAFT_1154719 [Mycena rosella]|uniref:Uncharacterized protein n=1 Tax=Mycena rosella TaxID=1033263 RepID=A0AAD7AXK0_MYCRO|nr:hypothetical protein B0H17DRAFT_1154719 [Mycena rosella]